MLDFRGQRVKFLAMLTDRERAVLSAQPLGARKGVAGWTYVRFRVRNNEHRALVEMSERLQATTFTGVRPGRPNVGTLMRAIGAGFLGLYCPREDRNFMAAKRVVEMQPIRFFGKVLAVPNLKAPRIKQKTHR